MGLINKDENSITKDIYKGISVLDRRAHTTHAVAHCSFATPVCGRVEPFGELNSYATATW
ncbi:MAG: hypothetical protein Q4F84_00700 [Fibrobacter sp.]|nr:hypothetical protein [Fibrobacter sp.]